MGAIVLSGNPKIISWVMKETLHHCITCTCPLKWTYVDRIKRARILLGKCLYERQQEVKKVGRLSDHNI